MSDKKMNVVVVGGDHYNTLWTIRSLGEIGIRSSVIVLAPDINKSFVSKSKFVKTCDYAHDADELLTRLLMGRSEDKQVIITCSDQAAEIVDQNQKELSNSYYIAGCIGTDKSLSYWLDKRNMLSLAKEVGLNVAYTCCVDLSKELEVTAFHDLPYPCLIKPEMSSHGSKEDYRICANLEELKASLASLKNVCNQVLIQEYLKPDYEATVAGVACDDVQIPTVTHKLRTCKDLHNLGMIAFSKLDSDVENLIEPTLIIQLIKKMGYKGCFSVDLMHAKGKTYFLEVNFRTDGTMFMSICGGVNFPAAWVDYCMNHKSIKLRLEKPIYGMTEISYVKYMDIKHPISIMKEWLKTDCYSIFSWHDIKPFFYKFLYAIKK